MLRPALALLLLSVACSSAGSTARDTVDASTEPTDSTSTADEGPSPGPDADAPDTDEPDVAPAEDTSLPTGPFCGDGACDDAETPANCPNDCVPSEEASCLEARCAAPLAACTAASDCGSTYQCLLGCATDACASACMDTSGPDAVEGVLGVLDCGLDSGCFGALGSCGDGTCNAGETATTCAADCAEGPACGDGLCGAGEGPVDCPEDCGSGPACGNGTCEDGETQDSCPNDCAAPGCGDGVCAADETTASCAVDCAPKSCVGKCDTFEEGAPCQCDSECVSYGDCCEDIGPVCSMPVCDDGICGKDEPTTCPGDCVPAPVCGDGQCGPSEDCPADCTKSCEGVCATYADGAPCQCDGACVGFGDCCPDYASLCTPAPTCGDGTCALLETTASCFADCAPVAPADCLVTHCPIGSCAGKDECQPSLDCIEGCPDLACAFGCIFKAPGGLQETLSNIAGCAYDKSCFPPPVVCGDGTCSFGETVELCPAECAAAPVCGDGTCAPGETVDGCPADCATAPTCAGHCSAFVQGAPCQCDGGCLGYGDCCADYGALCLPPEVCGDASCGTLETPASCPADCATLTGVACVKTKCPATACAGNDACEPVLACAAACPSAGCVATCLAGASAETVGLIKPLVACARQAGCLTSP